jgi:hypothetical protein
MGLDIELLTRPDERGHISFSYGGFGELRRRLADAAGLGDLLGYKGFGGTTEWPSIDDEPLVALLNHSDCDGELWSWQIEHLADRLLAVTRDWPKTEGPFVSDRSKVEEFAAVCRRCVDGGGVLAFR